MASPTNNSHRDWVNFFMPEAEAHVAELRRLGHYVSDAYAAACSYAGFAAFDAVHRGRTEIDLDRARNIAERMAGRTTQTERLAA
jgi:hypothetical protein